MAVYVLGFSYSVGAHTNSFALARVDGSRQLYKDAMNDLWKNFEQSNDDIGDRKLALVNVHYDADLLNLLLYTEARISIRADIVEFIEKE